MNLFTRKKQTHRCGKQAYCYQRGKRVINEKYRVNRYTPPYIKQTNDKDPLYSTGNSMQYLVINHNGKESEKNINK